MYYLLLAILFFNSSCSLFFKKNVYSEQLKELSLSDSDYRDHLESLASSYTNSSNVKLLRLSSVPRSYLINIYQRIAKNNELLIKQSFDFKVEFVDDKAPFIFSLPGGNIIISSGLLIKYFKNESLLIAALTRELIRTSQNIYLKSSIIPTGTISTERVISLTTLPLPDKVELNKWTYFSLKRAGYEQSAVLNWIQIQNKNSLDFSILNSNRRVVVEEELLFKKFLALQEVRTTQEEHLSSSKFYILLNEIKRKAHAVRNI